MPIVRFQIYKNLSFAHFRFRNCQFGKKKREEERREKRGERREKRGERREEREERSAVCSFVAFILK